MSKVLLLLTLLSLLWAMPQDAQAFKLNPCLRVLTIQEDKLGQKPILWTNPCPLLPDELQSAVHEHMSIAAIAKYRQKKMFQKSVWMGVPTHELNYMRPDVWRVGTGYQHETYAIIFGTWWNDDPNMYLLGEGQDFRKGVQKFRNMFSATKSSVLLSDLDSCYVPASQHIGYTSHFDALQHLHFMTFLGKEHDERTRLEAAIDDALIWIEFAYKVSTKEIKASDPLTTDHEQRLKLPSIAINLCLKNAGNAKVRSLFTRQGPSTTENLNYRNEITPDIALGSIFHILQDSFSPSHACRVQVQHDGKTVAALRRVFNYNEQDHDTHAKGDGYPGWLVEHVRTGRHQYANDPVAVGAWLLDAVDKKMVWSDVRTHLLSTVFAMAPIDLSGTTEACI